MEYENNLINESDKNQLDIIDEYRKKGKIDESFFPIMTYDLIQIGYPRADHGEMIARPWGGTNEKQELVDGGGMWCKVEDVKKYLLQYNIIL